MRSLVALVLLLILGILPVAAQTDYPGVYYEAGDNTYHQYADPWPAFYKHTLHSDHFDVFYGVEYGATAPDKLPGNDPLFVDVQDLLNKAEWFFQNYVNTLKFTTYETSNLSRYRMGIFIIHTYDWLATGSGNNDKVGALWVSPMTCHPVGSTIAHEIGHSFQFQVNCDFGGNTGFRYANGNGSSFWEATANWQAVVMYPGEMYSTSMYMYRNTHNFAMTHEWHRYESYWMHFWWCDQNGMDMVGRVWRGSPSWGADPNQSYMAVKGWNAEQLYRDYFLAAMHFVTWDFRNDDWRNRGAAFDIGNFNDQFVALGDDRFQVQYVSCPQSTGYNVIPIEVATPGSTITTHFTALTPGCALPEGDSHQFFNGANFQGTNRTIYNTFSGQHNRGFRVGYVALLRDGSRKYLYEDKVYCCGTNELTEDVICTVPDNVDRMWLVVSPAPTNYIVHNWDEDINNDDQWPYQVQFEGTTMLGMAKYYMYDEKSGLFLSRGGTDGVQAVVDAYGVPVSLTTSGNEKIITMLDDANGHLNGGAQVVTNGVATGYIPEKQTNGSYKYRNAATGGYLYISKGIVRGDGTKAQATSWKLVGSATRQRILAEKTAAEQTVVARQADIQLDGTTLADWVVTNYTFEDCTQRITNARLATNTNGWQLTGTGASAESNVLEIYEGRGSVISQKVQGLQPGVYKFVLSAFYRDGFPAACVGYSNTGFAGLSNAYIEANGNKARIAAWADERGGEAYPNWRSEAEACFKEGKYTNEVWAYVGQDGVLELKIATPQYMGGGWFCFANARLYRYSAPEGDMTSLIVNPRFEDATWGHGWSGCGTGAAWEGPFVKQTTAHANFSGNFAEVWGWLPGATLQQTIKGLENGRYKVEAYAIAYDQEQVDRKDIARFFAKSGNTTVEYKFTQPEPAALQSVTIDVQDGTLTFGIEAYPADVIQHNTWVAVDNFRLFYLGAPDGIQSLSGTDRRDDQHPLYNLYGQPFDGRRDRIAVSKGKKIIVKH